MKVIGYAKYNNDLHSITVKKNTMTNKTQSFLENCKSKVILR